jgi:hypothetical protein
LGKSCACAGVVNDRSESEVMTMNVRDIGRLRLEAAA